MNNLNHREKGFTAALEERLSEADSISADAMLSELELSEPYQNPSHENHRAYLNMRTQIIGKQLELRGINPFESGNDPDSSMLNNQRLYDDISIRDDDLGFSKDDKNFEVKRKNTLDYLDRLKAGTEPLYDINLECHVESTKKTLAQMDLDQSEIVKSREAELERIEEWELSQEAEQDARHAQMKKVFFKSKLQNASKWDREQIRELAEKQWSQLKNDYGF